MIINGDIPQKKKRLEYVLEWYYIWHRGAQLFSCAGGCRDLHVQQQHHHHNANQGHQQGENDGEQLKLQQQQQTKDTRQNKIK